MRPLRTLGSKNMWNPMRSMHTSAKTLLCRSIHGITMISKGVAVLVIAAPVQAQLFCDSDFSNSDWTATKIIDTSTPPGSFTSSQNTAGGNPVNFRSTQHTYNTPGGVVLIVIAHLRPAYTYSPSVCGKILSIDTQWDLVNTSSLNGNVAYRLLLYQSGAYYSGPIDQISNTGIWVNFSHTALVPSDFTKVAGNAGAPPNPDFSCTGDVIQLGFLSANSTPTNSPAGTFVTNSGVDNWCVTVHAEACSGPCPETNPVPNWSFEIKTGCPTIPGMSSLATPWSSPTLAASEYFHTCGAAPAGAPGNGVGFQFPHTGDGYAGIAAYNANSADYRSYLEVALTSPLVAERLYDVSFWVSLADTSQYCCDSIAALLNVGAVGPVNTITSLSTYSPQIIGPAGEPLSDVARWTRVHHAYKATGGEDHLLIGNFLDDSQTTLTTVSGGVYPIAYYYVDDVSVCEADPVCTCGAPSWADSFDSYVTGSILEGQGGWVAGWDNCGSTSPTTSLRRNSPPNSVAVISGSDLMQIYPGYASGMWTFRVMQFLPGASQADEAEPSWFRLLHEYNGLCTMFLRAHQSVEVEFDTVASQWKLFQGCAVVATGPLFFDQWVELRAEIDLNNDSVEVFYGNVSMAPPAPWTSSAACPTGPGANLIRAVKFTDYGSNTSSRTYYDCMSLTPYKAPVLVKVMSCGAGCLTLSPKVAAVSPNDVVVGRLPNALAHSFDAGTRIASYAILSFIDRNPTTGASVTYSPINPLGGPDTDHCITLLPSLSGTYPYQAEIVDQNFELLCQIDPELVAGTDISTYCTAMVNSQGCTPAMNWAGAPSSTFGSGFVISATSVVNNKTGILFYGTTGPWAVPFQGGTLCVKVPLKRTALVNSGGAPPPNDCSGMFSFDFNVRIASGIDPALQPGVTVNAQYWYRDPPTPSTTGLSDGIQFTIP